MKSISKIYSFVKLDAAGTLLCIVMVFHAVVHSQAQSYIVKKAPFSTKINDEFAPVFYENGIVIAPISAIIRRLVSIADRTGYLKYIALKRVREPHGRVPGCWQMS